MRPYLEKPSTEIELVEWFKVKVLSLSPSTTKKQNKKTPQSVGFNLNSLLAYWKHS
jgi:hypothetical protein